MKILLPLIFMVCPTIGIGAVAKLPEDVRQITLEYQSRRGDIYDQAKKDYLDILKKMGSKYVAAKEHERAALVSEEIKRVEGLEKEQLDEKTINHSLTGTWHCVSGIDTGAVILVSGDGSFVRNMPGRASADGDHWIEEKCRVKIDGGNEIIFTSSGGGIIEKGTFTGDQFELPREKQSSVYVRVK